MTGPDDGRPDGTRVPSGAAEAGPDAGPADGAGGADGAESTEARAVAVPPAVGRFDDDLPDDGPVIDPLDPLGLGDLPVDADLPDHHAARAGADATTSHGGTSRVGDDVPATGDGTSTGDRRSQSGTPGEAASPDDAPDAAEDGRVPGDDPTHEPEVVTTTLRATTVRARARHGAGGEGRSRAEGARAAASDGTAPPAPVRPLRSAWTRLRHAMRPRTTQGQLITAGLCALLGFALVVQVRQTSDAQLGALRQNDLVRLLDETTTRTDELEQEALDLQRERDELLSGSDRQQAALDAARRTAAMQGILTGRLPATGPGVRLTLTEPDNEIRPATMLHVLEELRNAGAEAMQLNGYRITASSAFTGTRGAIELDGMRIDSPFRWDVIGDPDTIAPALEIPGGALVQVRTDGGRGTVEKSDRVEVDAVRELPPPVHASPVADED